MSKVRKFLVALAGVAAVFSTVAADGTIDSGDVTSLVASVLAAVGVYLVPNKP